MKVIRGFERHTGLHDVLQFKSLEVSSLAWVTVLVFLGKILLSLDFSPPMSKPTSHDQATYFVNVLVCIYDILITQR